MKRILLINPPFFRFLGLEQDYVPLSLLAVGSKLVEVGNQVVIKNMEVGPGLGYQGYAARSDGFERYLSGVDDIHNPIWNELRQTIESFCPYEIGVSVLNVKFRSFCSVNNIAKEYGIPVFVGGPHTVIEPNIYPKDVRVFPGEYESDGKRLKNLDELPLPNFDILLDIDKYSPDAFAHLMTSRGCPFHCRFCSSATLWKRKVTYKSVDRVLSEMKYIEDRFGPKYFTFWDEVFTLHPGRLREFCSRYGLLAKWRCDTRANILTDEVVKMMVSAGCGQMSVGVESGVDRILKYVGKGETTDDYIKASEVLNKHSVEWKAYCIIGFPEETAEDMRQTISFIKSLRPFRITLSFFTPYMGTPLFDECKQSGLIGANSSTNDFFHQGPYNYFCPKLSVDEYIQTRDSILKEVDEYNKEALLTWH